MTLIEALQEILDKEGNKGYEISVDVNKQDGEIKSCCVRMSEVYKPMEATAIKDIGYKNDRAGKVTFSIRDEEIKKGNNSVDKIKSMLKIMKK